MNSLTTDSRLLLGASWYPEMWPPSAWADDVAKMAELGFNIVRLFEFAWHRMEPEEGRYDLDWARQVMDLCHRHGIAVMVGTPTAAPPAWLTSRYPDVLRVNLKQFPEITYVKIYDQNGQTADPDGLSDSIPACLEP